MKKTFIVIIILVALFSCKSEKEKNIIRLTSAIRQYFEDIAFKNNAKFDLLEINSVSYKMVGQNALDTMKLYYVNNCFNKYNKKIKSLDILTESNLKLVALYKELHSNTLCDQAVSDVKDNIATIELYNDSLQQFNKKDSLIRIRMKNRKTDNTNLFKTKFFCKSTVSGKNLMDTLTMIFDENFKVILPVE